VPLASLAARTSGLAGPPQGGGRSRAVHGDTSRSRRRDGGDGAKASCYHHRAASRVAAVITTMPATSRMLPAAIMLLSGILPVP